MTPDEQSIHDILNQLEAAWNASDSQTWAAAFADEATFIHIYGGQLDGRATIEASHRIIFDTIYKGSRASFQSRSIRMLRPDVAIVWTRGLVVTAEGNNVETRPTMVVAKNGAKWQIVAFQNTRITEMPAAVEAARKLAT